MTQLVFSEAELFTEHDYAGAHEVMGRKLHGGFLADGSYAPPRSLIRSKAIETWTEALRERGGHLLDADSSLLVGIRVPNLAQHQLLLRNGLGQTFWNQLTTTGKIEARGRALAEMAFPDLAPVIASNISEMGIGHLNTGLLSAHGLDEGGIPEEGIGGHDAMWFAARDLVFGLDVFDDVEPPERIGRPEAESDEPVMPEIQRPIETYLSFLMNLLIIEFRAEIGFAMTQEIFRTDGLFPGREAEAAEAAEIIERIRIDELVHVLSLRLYLGELRGLDFNTVDGVTIAGSILIDRMWDDLVRWATIEQPPLAARQQLDLIEPRILAHPDGDRLLGEFRELAEDPTAQSPQRNPPPSAPPPERPR